VQNWKHLRVFKRIGRKVDDDDGDITSAAGVFKIERAKLLLR